MATLVHFDIGANDPERAKVFYEKLFGWQIEKLTGPMNYYMVRTTDLQGKAGIGGGLAKRDPGRVNGIINYIGVASINRVLEQVSEQGGEILQPVQSVPGYGLLAVCEDPEQNVFGLFEEVPADVNFTP